MGVRLLLSLVAIGCTGCDSSSSSVLDGGVDGQPDGGSPPQVALGAKCVGQGGDQASASISVDGQGNALVAWPRSVGGEVHIVTCSLRQGVWQAAQDVGAGTSPVVVLAGDGSGVVAWTEPGGSLVAARYVDGQLGPPTTAVPEPAAYRDLALLPDGDAVMLASGLELRSYHYDAQVDLWDPTPRLVPVGNATTISSPRLGATADGLIAVWQESDLATSQGAIRAARFTPAAAQWTSTSAFADVAAAVASDEPERALLDTSPPGHALVVLDFRETDVLSASAYDAAAGHWTPQVLHGGEPSPPLHSSGGMDAFGRGWVTWAVQPPFADFEIHGRRFANGWGEAELLISTPYVASAVVTVADAGKALLLSIEAGAPDMVLRAAVAEPDGTFGPSGLLLDGFLAEGGSLRIATGPNGHSVATWLEIPGGLTAAVIAW